jgi:hypothetical protein
MRRLTSVCTRGFVDSLTMNSARRTMFSIGNGFDDSMFLIKTSAAFLPNSSKGARIVVRSTGMCRENGISSFPTTEISSGTLIFISVRTAITYQQPDTPVLYQRVFQIPCTSPRTVVQLFHRAYHRISCFNVDDVFLIDHCRYRPLRHSRFLRYIIDGYLFQRCSPAMQSILPLRKDLTLKQIILN